MNLLNFSLVNWKKTSWLFLITAGLFLFSTKICLAETIDNFNVEIKINQDSSINVSEKIEYDFGDLEKHGIYRYLPIKYQARGGNYNLRISDISVTDENNEPYLFEISYPGDNMQLKIGNPDLTISGKHIYIINYKIKRAINYFADHDELYWNATGNEWPVDIDNSSLVVTLPAPINVSQIQKQCFSGYLGSENVCQSMQISAGANGLVDKISFSQGLLNPDQGLTAVVGWPKGFVFQPTWQENLRYFLEDNKGVFLPFLILLFCWLYWFLKGKDPQGRGTIIAEYEAPDNLCPAEVGTIYDEKAQPKDISAEIINLAVTGCLKIKREITGSLFKKPAYTLIKLKECSEKNASYDFKLLNSLFGSKTEVKLADLKEDFYKDYQEITNDIYSGLVAKEYFPKNPSKMRNFFLIFGIMAVFFIYGFFNALATPIGMVSCVISVIIVIIASRFMSQRTAKGVLAKEQILGLKEFLTVAEKDRIKFHNAPEKNPELFEKLLPYAMVLGVETQWAGQFADIYKEPPKWYASDEPLADFNAVNFAGSLQAFSSQANSVYSPPASTASGGGSGFSGGGSGGGFGGGGGGSW